MKLHGKQNRRRGTEALEAALILPMMLILIFGAVEASWFFYVQHIVEGAAREGARNAVLATSDLQSATDAIKAALQGTGVTVADADIKFEPGDPDTVPAGEQIKVTVISRWSNYKAISFFGYITHDPAGYAVMVKEAS